MGWFEDNAYNPNDQVGPVYTDPRTADVASLYQQLLGRAPESDQVVNQWIAGTGGNLDAIRSGIANSDEGKAYLANAMGPGTSTQGPTADAPSSGSWIDQTLASVSSTDDPNYWKRVIAADPKVAAGDQSAIDYWKDRIRRGDGSALVANGTLQKFNDSPAGTSGSSGSTMANFGGYTPAPSFVPPQAPVYSPYTPTLMATPKPFVAPTLEEARNSPGYQSALDAANRGFDRSAVAKGNILSGGAIQERDAMLTGLGDQNYQNVWNRALAANNSDFAQALGVNQSNNAAGLSAAGLNAQGINQQFQNTYLPAWQSYLSDVGQNQFGSSFGLSANNQAFGQDLANRQFGLQSQNQFWNQGFQENQNAYDQYDNSQKTAFDQWLKLANLGHPGNPYA